MFVNDMEKMFKKFEDIESFEVRFGKKMTASTTENVVTALQEETSSEMQTCFVWGIVRSLDMRGSMVYNILRTILHWYPYRITHVHQLLPANLPVTFAL